MQWQDATEIVAGCLFAGRIDASEVNPENMFPPYDGVVLMLRDGKNIADIVDKIGLSIVQAGRSAYKSVEGQEMDWLAVLSRSASRHKKSTLLIRCAKKLQDGDDSLVGDVLTRLQDEEDFYSKYITADEAKGTVTWQNTYWKAWDENIGSPDPTEGAGVPKGGLIIIAAPPGTGKTTAALQLIGGAIRNGKNVLMYSLEMPSGQIVKRSLQIDSSLTSEDLQRFYLCSDLISLEDLVADASRLAKSRNLYAIFVDFADLLVEGKEDEQNMAIVYRELQKLARRTEVPVFLLAQLNREYRGGIPRINNIRYSGLAEALGAVVVMLYNPNQIWASQGTDARLPVINGIGYIIVGKSRFGFKNGSPGAIQLSFEDGRWGDEANGWMALTSV